jgi:hypothetical protein
MKLPVPLTTFVVLLMISSAAASKSATVKIEIAGTGLTRPLEIAEPALLSRFSIWGSPGIDWSRGIVTPPKIAATYIVTFYQGGREPMHDWHRRYVVFYAIDPESKRGYIYLPGPQNGELYKRNTFSIVRDVEGNWFAASPEWEASIRPLIDHVSSAQPAFRIKVAFDRESDQMILKCETGCSWKELTWGCANREDCSSPIDEGGMAP